jgi:hypothetical protein
MPSPNRAPHEAPQNDWLDRLARFNAHFGRFLRDVGGVTLLALAAILLMALWGITHGLLLNPLVAFL